MELCSPAPLGTIAPGSPSKELATTTPEVLGEGTSTEVAKVVVGIELPLLAISSLSQWIQLLGGFNVLAYLLHPTPKQVGG